MIHHVALEIPEAEVAASVAFWGLLGFERVPVPEGLVGETVWVERGGTQIHLMFQDDPVAAPKGHVAVVCSDYAETLQRLRGSGFAPDPRTEHWGAPRCFVLGPAGHRVEVMAAPPGATA